ncbi:MAG: aromatic acid/H+ symport family MFS transporter [Gammaproteobacteria bacterium]|nr:aromatic acid/H+ symport family MFS transporter [Gammaproteobacteria bacterium]
MVTGGRSVEALIDEGPVKPLQWWVVVLCTLVIVFDGFDVQAIAFTAPVLMTEWALAKGSLGPVFGAGLVGMALGALILGPLGDTFGRKSAILISVATFSLFSLLTATATSYEGLFAYRLLTGLGLGGALPNATALIAEYAPRRLRNLMISLIFLGIPIGGMTGGVLAAEIIPYWGWEGVFLLGGLGPLLLLPVLMLALPESLRFLANRGVKREVALKKVLIRLQIEPDTVVMAAPPEATRSLPLVQLFKEGLARDTVLLWATFFLNLMAIYFLISWIPSLLVSAGYGVSDGAYTAVVLNLGGAIGPLLLAWLIGRFGSRLMLVIYFLCAALAVALLGRSADHLALVMLMTFLAGFFTFGAQIGLNALAASIYPTTARSTGVGWALGVGRIGSILGPVLGGVLLALGWAMPGYFGLFGLILLVAVLTILLVDRHQRPSYSR